MWMGEGFKKSENFAENISVEPESFFWDSSQSRIILENNESSAIPNLKFRIKICYESSANLRQIFQQNLTIFFKKNCGKNFFLRYLVISS